MRQLENLAIILYKYKRKKSITEYSKRAVPFDKSKVSLESLEFQDYDD